MGITEAQILELWNYEASSAFSDLERLVIAYAAGMTITPVEVPGSLFAALRGHFNEAQMVELTAAVAWENYRGRFHHAFGIESQGFAEGAVCALPERPGTAESQPRREPPAARSAAPRASKESPQPHL